MNETYLAKLEGRIAVW